MSEPGRLPKRQMKVRPRKDMDRVFKILTGPVYHDPLFHPFIVEGDPHFVSPHDAVLERKSPTKMPRNVAPLVCNIKSGDR